MTSGPFLTLNVIPREQLAAELLLTIDISSRQNMQIFCRHLWDILYHYHTDDMYSLCTDIHFFGGYT